jgi:hypothetical protein
MRDALQDRLPVFLLLLCGFQLGQDLRQRLPLDELHGVVGDLLFDAHPIDGDYIGMGEATRNLGLAHETPHRLAVGRETCRQHLHCDLPVHGALPGLVDDSHAAPADLTQELIIAEDTQGVLRFRAIAGIDESLELIQQLRRDLGVGSPDLVLVEAFSRIETVDILRDEVVQQPLPVAGFMCRRRAGGATVRHGGLPRPSGCGAGDGGSRCRRRTS